MAYREYNFDGLVGPTHNYAGLGTGNLASMASKHHVSSPRAAALEGLAKMKLLAEMGVPQAILPPQRRPHVGYLRMRYSATGRTHPGARGRRHSDAGDPCPTNGTVDAGRGSGDSGTGLPSADPWHGAPIDWITDRPKIDEVAALLRAAAENGEEGRRDLAIASSASAMWAANAATVSPSPDTADGRLHITPANLVSQPHRALEAAERHRLLAHMFGDMMRFDVHPPLSKHNSDEGAANHTRLAREHGRAGAEIFTFGTASSRETPRRFRPRQHLFASLQIARYHEPFWPYVNFFTKQSRDAIDAGVFHNDVICVGNGNVLLTHERAWCAATTWNAGVASRWSAFNVPCAEPRTIDVQQLFWETHSILGLAVQPIVISESELPLPDAVKSYLFNSQLV